MSLAWEVTAEDIELVLAEHGVNADSEEILATYFTGDDRVEAAVLAYLDFDEQTEAASSEIEDILLEAFVITGPKLFTAP